MSSSKKPPPSAADFRRARVGPVDRQQAVDRGLVLAGHGVHDLGDGHRGRHRPARRLAQAEEHAGRRERRRRTQPAHQLRPPRFPQHDPQGQRAASRKPPKTSATVRGRRPSSRCLGQHRLQRRRGEKAASCRGGCTSIATSVRGSGGGRAWPFFIRYQPRGPSVVKITFPRPTGPGEPEPASPRRCAWTARRPAARPARTPPAAPRPAAAPAASTRPRPAPLGPAAWG